MVTQLKSNTSVFPGDSCLLMGALVADILHDGDLSGFTRGLTVADMAVVSEHIVACEYILLPESPSWWMTVALPAIDQELDRRCRPKPITTSGSPLARLKALDLANVAGRYTELQRSGPGKLKGRCPLHKERTPSFYIYTDSQRWRCFGACATGGDVVNLLAAIRRKAMRNG